MHHGVSEAEESFYSMKQVMYQHGQEGRSLRKKQLLQTQHKKAHNYLHMQGGIFRKIEFDETELHCST